MNDFDMCKPEENVMTQQDVWKALADGETVICTDKQYADIAYIKFINGFLHRRTKVDSTYRPISLSDWNFFIYRYSILEKPTLEKRLEQGPVLCWASLNSQFTTTLTLIKIPELIGYRDIHGLYWDNAIPAKIEDIERYIWSNDEEI